MDQSEQEEAFCQHQFELWKNEKPTNTKSSDFDDQKFQKRFFIISSYASRQSDRSRPRIGVNSNVIQLSKICGEEMPGVLLATLIALPGCFGNKHLEKQLVLLLWLSLSIDIMLSLESYSHEYVQIMNHKI